MPTFGERFSLVHSLPKPEKDIFIYALCEPNSENIRYIGLATTGFKRIKRHYDGGGEWSSVKKWIRDLKHEGKIFNLIYLEYFDNDNYKVDESEIFYITYMKFLGFDLLNHTEGGRRNFQFRTDKKLPKKEVHQSLEAKAYFSQKSKEMWAQPGFKEENSKLIKEAQLAKKEEYRKKMTEFCGLKIQDDLGNIYNSGQECATALGVKKTNVYRAIRKGYKCQGRVLTYLGGGRNETLTPAWTEYKKKNQLTVTKVPIQDSNGIIYETFKDAAIKLNVSESHINKILKTGEISSILGVTLKRLPKIKEIRRNGR